MLGLVTAVTLIAVAASQIHHHGGFHQGGTHAHPEQGSVSFIYDPATHYLIASTSHTCYFMPMEGSQETYVHSPTGMERLELKMMAMMSGAETPLTDAQLEKHSRIISMACHGDKMFMVGAQSTGTSGTTVGVSSPEN
ncbi:uncharacterized protein [Argopecten irradians]|uniref:uncharacterized protein n=1 Tax=Argopecten irradians TaxID=31199 RepID=UPI003723CAFF